jgi:hypothetical protein
VSIEGHAGGPLRATRDLVADGRSEEPVEPSAFTAAVEALAAARLRPEVEIEPLPAPRRLAPYAHALSAVVLDRTDDTELASGRFVLLHDPAGHEAWQGDFRVVTLARADLEPEMADDPLLAEVGWAWLVESLHEYGAEFRAEGGTVTRCSSNGFGELSNEPAVTSVEIRASWTPVAPVPPALSLPGRPPAVTDAANAGYFGQHLRAWVALLATCAGMPPYLDGVTALPPRRGGGR